ncbi:DUF3570 domain-containing protein [Zunongwangia sp. F363]|uniref:DUF3570 domain-containing protein n=1 Tax=Autumnicola tepida TaxID=3075595 RepID=A0ABU3C9T7_9FLAO|nr:DUF3570 domain-containing protein [Zunongwangia sp. F363]MDT0643102.1 DUF3570 domain-containing protein [Zunongwangia sp. F363]
MQLKLKFNLLVFFAIFGIFSVSAQEQVSEENAYKKRVLENTEIDFLTSYYSQDGENAAVSGGKGTEELTDFTPTIVVSIPLNADDVLTIDAGVSAYTSTSSSNVDPFDGSGPADPFTASSGASQSDTWANLNATYSHSSNDRNKIWTANFSVASEYDYFSLGFGGSFTKLWNDKNTELTVNGNVFLDTWNPIYPYELRPFGEHGKRLGDALFSRYHITGNAGYNPVFSEFTDKGRNSYSLGFNFSQILTERMQASIALDLVQQSGLLSTPFQRVYFRDIENSFIEDFQLADAIEQLPDNRLKVAAGGRLNYYLNEIFVLRGYYRFYNDDWGIQSHTASLEIPIKLGTKFTLYPSYRYYMQTAADYFAGYEMHTSSEEYYTSDYDLSRFSANQYSFGVNYTDIFTQFHLWSLHMKSIDLRYLYYKRNSGLKSNLISAGINFIVE